MIFPDRYTLENNVWAPKEKFDFNYSDGDEVENYILQSILQSEDLSIGSGELCSYIKDWPSLYHLSPKRADLLRPFHEQLKDKTVLEIGSGCGAITRYLGEIPCKVTALEGSFRRAGITAARCRNLDNVQVVCDNFESFLTDEKFDCITLIGVLEYSNLFVKGDNAPATMLSRVKSLLKPGGFIIIAIENKLGLKYFAGAPEDHLGTAFVGIENRYSHETAVTFGKEELKQLLFQTDLEAQDFLYPFPDYKLPSTIVTDAGLAQKDFDVAGLLLEKHDYIQGHEYNRFFNLSLAARELAGNNLLGDMSHSFLVAASAKANVITDVSLLAVNYTSARKKPYCKSVEFRRAADATIQIKKQKAYPQAGNEEDLSLVLHDELYQRGTLLQEHLLQIVSKKNWTIDELTQWAQRYYDILKAKAKKADDRFYVDGKYIDLTPFNIIIKKNGESFIFDQEWDCHELLFISYVFFRGIYYSLGQIVYYNIPDANTPRCVLELSTVVLERITGKEAAIVVDAFRNTERRLFSQVWLQSYEPFQPEPLRIYNYDLKKEEADRTAAELNATRESHQETVLSLDKQTTLLSGANEQLADVNRLLSQEILEKQRFSQELKQLQEESKEILEKSVHFNRELQEKERVLQDAQFNLSLTRQKLNETNDKLNTIYNSDGWKLLNRYYNWKGRFLNADSWHYKALKRIINILRNRKERVDEYSSPQTKFQVSEVEDNFTAVLPVFEKPEVSIIIPVYNAWSMNVKCIRSIIEHTADISYELIIADDCSTDKTRNISNYFTNIVHVRNEKNLGFLLNCNHAASYAKGKYIHFLNNDTEVRPGWLSSLALLMNKDETIGMTGSKLIYPDGRLQEAGGIIWNDASGWNFGNNQNPDMPEFNYVKEVDYISGASIMIRKWIWDELGGFDADYSPAYCEDSDMAFRIRAKGLKVVLQPLSVVVHYEGYSHGSDTQKSEISSIKEYQVFNNKKFFEKWKKVLHREQLANGEDVFWARDRSRSRKTLLMVDHYVPQFDKDAGSRTTFQYLELFVKLGFNVKFIGENFYRDEPYTTILQQMGIEVLYGPWYAANWKQWFLNNKEKFDYIYLNRPHISINFIDFFKEHSSAKILYYGHDLHFLRKERRYAIEKDKNLLALAAKWKEIEMYLFSKSDIILTPSIDEQKIIQSLNSDFNVQLMRPYIYKTVGEPVLDFTDRKDIFFVGGFGHSPNVDGVLWFVKEVWPLVKLKLPAIQFIIAGSNPPAEIKDLSKDPDIIIKGYVADDELERLYSSSRIAVIPLRYGAGVKGKTVEAMRYGIPLVTTSFGVEGLPGDFSFLHVSDDVHSLAELVVELYENEAMLKDISSKGVQYIKDNFTEEVATEIISNALATAELEKIS